MSITFVTPFNFSRSIKSCSIRVECPIVKIFRILSVTITSDAKLRKGGTMVKEHR